jgi:hypothetical protein
MERLVITLAATAAMFCLATPKAAGAQVIFDDIGSGYDCCSGVSIGGSSSFVGVATYAAQFTAPSNDIISEIDLGLTDLQGPGAVDFTLYSDAAGKLGSPLAYTSLIVANDGSSSTETANWTNVGVRVSAGDSYWIFGKTQGDNWVGWNFNLEGSTGPSYNSFVGYENTTLPAFTVLGGGTPMPEPTIWASMILGLLGTGAALRGLRRASAA